MMTRFGVIVNLYSKIESRPYSMFTQNPDEIIVNEQWLIDAMTWGEKHVDRYGNKI